jgi:hypothetical protein
MWETFANPTACFPARVGVFPGFPCSGLLVPRFPRICGGGSMQFAGTFIYTPSSPPTRGYFHVTSADLAAVGVFPANAGVFPTRTATRMSDWLLPRTRGGGYFQATREPRGHDRVRLSMDSPVHAEVTQCTLVSGVSMPFFPRSCGGVSKLVMTNTITKRFPRACGGVSNGSDWWANKTGFSPHARGCFHHLPAS